MIERVEWLTRILPAYRGEEQRASLRVGPRKAVEFSFMVDDVNRQLFEAALWAWGSSVWALPLWFDGTVLGATITGGTTSIPVDTATRDYRAGGLALLLDPEDARVSEVLTIDTVDGDSIELADPVVATWPAGSLLFPARAARLTNAPEVPRFTGQAATSRAQFLCDDPDEYEADAGDAAYRSLPVLERRPSWAEDPALAYPRKATLIDNQVGKRVSVDEGEQPFPVQSQLHTMTTRAEIGEMRALFHALRGRQGSIWVPTWAEDLTLAASAGGGATNLTVKKAGYVDLLDLDVNRRDVRIELRSGAVHYRRITAAAPINASTEQITIDSALGVAVAPTDVAAISFMALCRSNSDTLELDYFTGECANAKLAWKAFRHEL